MVCGLLPCAVHRALSTSKCRVKLAEIPLLSYNVYAKLTPWTLISQEPYHHDLPEKEKANRQDKVAAALKPLLSKYDRTNGCP